MQNMLPDVIGVGNHLGVGAFVAWEASGTTYIDYEQNVILDAETRSWGITLPGATTDYSPRGLDISYGYYDNDQNANTLHAIGGRSAYTEVGGGTLLVVSAAFERNTQADPEDRMNTFSVSMGAGASTAPVEYKPIMISNTTVDVPSIRRFEDSWSGSWKMAKEIWRRNPTGNRAHTIGLMMSAFMK